MFGFFAPHSLLSQTLSKQFVVPQQLNGVSGPIIGVADLNGDGRPDILYKSQAEIATGNGTFKLISEPITFSNPTALADVNHDGKIDVIEVTPTDEFCYTDPDGSTVCDTTTDATVQVYLGKGDGTFTSGPGIDLGQEGAGVAAISIADVNGDGKPDVIVTFTGAIEDSASVTGYVLLNDGTGNFKLAPQTFGYHPVYASADLNGDGHVDLVVGPALGVLWGKGDGTFTQGPGASLMTTSATIGDFNHDGHLDIATNDTSFSSKTGVYVLWGGAGGTFTAPKRISTLPSFQIQAADLNHDGYVDLLASYFSGANGYGPIEVFTNQKNGTFSSPKIFATANLSGGPFWLADFNRDGYLDIAQSVTISYGAGGATFQVPQITQSAFATNTAVGDFNGDGIDDVATINSSTGAVTVFNGSGHGYLKAGTSYSTGILGGVVSAGDINGDGAPDLIVTRGYNSPSSAPNDVAGLINVGDGTFGSAIVGKVLGSPLAYANRVQVDAVDVNHDGKADLVGDWGVALGHGDGTFSAANHWPSWRFNASRYE